MTVEEAYGRLKEIQDSVQYGRRLKDIGVMGVAVFFTLLLGGGARDCLAAAVTGISLAAAWRSPQESGSMISVPTGFAHS